MAGKKTDSKKTASISKSALLNAVSEETGGEVTRKQVKLILETLSSIAYRELKKSGLFTVPGFAKFRVVKKPATKARKGINPFTGQETMFKAKPARKVVKIQPLKALKDML